MSEISHVSSKYILFYIFIIKTVCMNNEKVVQIDLLYLNLNMLIGRVRKHALLQVTTAFLFIEHPCSCTTMIQTGILISGWLCCIQTCAF